MRRWWLLLSLVFLAANVAYFFWPKIFAKTNFTNEVVVEQSVLGTSTSNVIKALAIPQGTTFIELLVREGVTDVDAHMIYNSALPQYDLAKIRAGRDIKLIYQDDYIVGLKYDLDDSQELIVELKDGRWSSELRTINYEIKQVLASGIVKSSLYEAGLAVGLAESLIVELGDVFQWTIDFSMDVREGDSFEVLYEDRTREGLPASPGKILAAKYLNDSQLYELYYFVKSDGKGSYFDAEGRSAPKKFLKAPVAFRYISSGFSTNPRYVGGQYQRFTSNHLAIDYAAPTGTPIRSVGDGKVVYAGWKSGYGNFISIRHDGVYTTNYAHLSKISVKRGQSVTQNQTIGLVGSTGFSTGPHLHYEMVKNGSKINPLKEIQPPTAPLMGAELENFIKQRDAYRQIQANK